MFFVQKQVMYKVSSANNSMQQWWAWSEGPDVFVKWGKVDGRTQVKHHRAQAKNIGRSNETTPTEQAELEVTSLYEDRYNNKHYRPSKEEAIIFQKENCIPRKLGSYEPVEGKFYTSAKLNGSRACIIDGKLKSKAGRVEGVKVPHIAKAINQLKELGFPNLDGEIYAHGLSLQRIRSAWLKPFKNPSELKRIAKDYYEAHGHEIPYDPNTEYTALSLHVFDIPVSGVPVNERMKMLEELRKTVVNNGIQGVTVVSYYCTKDDDQRQELLNAFINTGFEGAVHLHEDDYYRFDVRSNTALKHKRRLDSEAKVIACEICKNGEGKLTLSWNNISFKAMMKGTRAERDYEVQRYNIGKWVTFEYEELSDKNIPTKPVVLGIRNCNEQGEPLE